MAHARWIVDDETIELMSNGHVLFDGDLVFVVDSVGRVTNDDYDPEAILMVDGAVVGTDDRDLGHIGRTNGAPPGSETAWFSIGEDGNVVYYGDDGERMNGGRWQGCGGEAMRTCALITHLTFVRASVRRQRSGVGVGFGVGVGVWR